MHTGKLCFVDLSTLFRLRLSFLLPYFLSVPDASPTPLTFFYTNRLGQITILPVIITRHTEEFVWLADSPASEARRPRHSTEGDYWPSRAAAVKHLRRICRDDLRTALADVARLRAVLKSLK